MDYLITQHLREHFRFISQQNPNLTCLDVKDLSLIYSSGKPFSANYLLGITPADDLETYAHLIEQAVSLNALPLTWFSYPADPTLMTLLESAGLKKIAPLTGIFYDLKQLQRSPASPFKISIAKDVTHFKDFLFVFEQTWNYPSGYGDFFFCNLLNTKRFIPFITYQNEQPVGICALDIQEETAGCYWDCVLPDYRQQGIGQFMIQHRLRYAQENGCHTVVAQCLPSSLNLYLKLGFQKACEMALFRYARS